MLRFAAPVSFLILVATACGPRTADVVVERLDVAVTVQADGSARIVEQFSARFGSTPASSFRRHLPVWRHDGISDISAALDGVPSQIHVETGPGLDVEWTFASTSATARVFTLSYRARNVVALSGIRGTVSWLVLPGAREFDVSAAFITLTLPDSAILLQDPWVDEAGWTVTRLPHGMTAARLGVSTSDSATVGIEFTIDGMAMLKPVWQFDAERADEFMPAFVSAGLFILVVGAGVVAMLRFKYPQASVPATDPERLASALDLRRTAWVVLIVGIGAWVFVATQLRHYGIWPLAVPVSMLGVGLLFLAAAAHMLYFARVRDGRTPV